MAGSGRRNASVLKKSMAATNTSTKAQPVKLLDQKTAHKRPMKKRKARSKEQKALQQARNSRALLDEYGLCPISLAPMRRPVLPSSGQAYDEINIIRFCNQGRKCCPVSGAPLKFLRWQLARTPDFALRNLIVQQSKLAKVYIAPCDAEALLADVHGQQEPAAKALVDDVYLGYVPLSQLSACLQHFRALADPLVLAMRNSRWMEPPTLADVMAPPLSMLAALVAECLACRKPEIVNAGLQMLSKMDELLQHPVVLQEALGVGQDADCRGDVLDVMLAVVRRGRYTASQLSTMLQAATESVPLQKFQAAASWSVLTSSKPVPGGGASLNVALCACCDSNQARAEPLPRELFWGQALQALRACPGGSTSLSAAAAERLFAASNNNLVSHLARKLPELLRWHLAALPDAMDRIVAWLGSLRKAPHCHAHCLDLGPGWGGEGEASGPSSSWDMSSDSEDLGEGVNLHPMDSESDVSDMQAGEDAESGDDVGSLGRRYFSQAPRDLDIDFGSRLRPVRAQSLSE